MPFHPPDHGVEWRRSFILQQYIRCCLPSKRQAPHLFDSTFLLALSNFACSSQLWTTFKTICKACHIASNVTLLCYARTFSCKTTSYLHTALPGILTFAGCKAVSLFPYDTILPFDFCKSVPSVPM